MLADAQYPWFFWIAPILTISFLAMAIGLVSVFAGLTAAYYGDLPPGGMIVLVAAAAFALLTVAGTLRRT